MKRIYGSCVWQYVFLQADKELRSPIEISRSFHAELGPELCEKYVSKDVSLLANAHIYYQELASVVYFAHE